LVNTSFTCFFTKAHTCSFFLLLLL
jgi:hypothetical protein